MAIITFMLALTHFYCKFIVIDPHKINDPLIIICFNLFTILQAKFIRGNNRLIIDKDNKAAIPMLII